MAASILRAAAGRKIFERPLLLLIIMAVPIISVGPYWTARIRMAKATASSAGMPYFLIANTMAASYTPMPPGEAGMAKASAEMTKTFIAAVREISKPAIQ